MKNLVMFWSVIFILLTLVACQVPSLTFFSNSATHDPGSQSADTPLPPRAVTPGESNPDEPVFVRGKISYTSPFFVNSLAEPFVLLEDEAGFVKRDRNFIFKPNSQDIGPVIKDNNDTLSYMLSLPAIPQGTFVDVDNNGKSDEGVQVFAIAYWSNTWGGPFLEQRDGTGWSTSYSSALTDPENNDEMTGGTLIVWSPDNKQGFPTDFGADGLLFTADDPCSLIPAGYNLINLDQRPFRFYKEAEPTLSLNNEGDIALKDFSKDNYQGAFKKMFEKVALEYPFTSEKKLNWDALRQKYLTRIADVATEMDFYEIVHDFLLEFPDGHVGGAFNARAFNAACGGGFGLSLTELTDRRVIVTKVFPSSPAQDAGIKEGAEIITWNGKPVAEAIDGVVPYFGNGSTAVTKRLGQILFLTRVPPDTEISVVFKNPDEYDMEAKMTAIMEYDSLTSILFGGSQDALALPVEGRILNQSGLGYIRINTFSDDDNLEARLWDRYMKNLLDNEAPGLIIDMRQNGGGNLGLAMNFIAYFFEKEFDLFKRTYYNEEHKKFEEEIQPTHVIPAPILFKGKVAVLISPECMSACEGFTYAMAHDGRARIIGHYPSAGMFGEIGRGQYKLPGNLKLQFPTGRPEDMDGNLIIEGRGIQPDIVVPITENSALGKVDAVLEAAIEELSQ